MAFISQEKKKEIGQNIKPILKKYGIKGTLRIEDGSFLVLTIREGKLNFKSNYINNKEIYIKRGGKYSYEDEGEHWHQQVCLSACGNIKSIFFTDTYEKCLIELSNVMMNSNHDNSNPMIDYHDVGWYAGISIGTWEKPYKLVKQGSN